MLILVTWGDEKLLWPGPPFPCTDKKVDEAQGGAELFDGLEGAGGREPDLSKRAKHGIGFKGMGGEILLSRGELFSLSLELSRWALPFRLRYSISVPASKLPSNPSSELSPLSDCVSVSAFSSFSSAIEFLTLSHILADTVPFLHFIFTSTPLHTQPITICILLVQMVEKSI